MRQRPLPIVPTICALALAAVPVSARAAVGFGVLPQSIADVAMGSQDRCAAPVQPALGSVQTVTASASSGKASAILGGRVSRLELMRRQQAGQAVPTPALASASTVTRLAPATVPSGLACQKFAQEFTMPSVAAVTIGPGLRQASRGSDDFLASKRIPIRRTSFDADWRRVQRQGLSRSFAAALSGSMPHSANFATLAAVNSWTNARVRYVEDRALYGRADYWASAETTLRRGAGDCEDIAIAKLQLLAALGVSRSDMFLTITRDLVRNADHAVLVVKLDGRMWLLDNSTSEVLDASQSHDYRPIMSFSTSRKWLHGYSQL